MAVAQFDLRGSSRTRLTAAALAACVLVLCPAWPAHAVVTRCDGVTMPERERAFGVDLVLNGMGIRRITIFNIHIFVAGLYLERRTRSSAEAMHKNAVKLMALAFSRSADRETMMDFLRSRVSKRAPAKKLPALLKSLDKLGNLFPEIRKGDRVTIAYRKGSGLEVRHAGKLRGVQGDEALAELMFDAWVGPHPSDEDMTAGLLGGECE